MFARILLLLLATVLCAVGNFALNSGTTSNTFERVDEGRQYRITGAGTWAGATVTIEAWSTTLNNWAPSTTLTSASPAKSVIATGPRFRASIAGGSGSESVAVEFLRLPEGTLDNGTVNAAIAEDPAATLSSLATNTGRLNLSGTTLSGTGWNGNGVADGIFLGDLQNLGFARPDGGAMGSIYGWYNHDSDGGEFLMESTHRIALAQGENGAIQIGLTRAVDNKSFVYVQQRWTPTVGSQLGESLPLIFNSSTYGIDAEDTTWAGIQGRATAAGDNEMVFFAGSTFPDGPRTDASMPEIAAVTVEGLRDPMGNDPDFIGLTDGATVTVTCSSTKAFQNTYVTLSGNRSLAFSGLQAGMRGTLIVSQDSVGNRTLSLPSNAATQSGFALSTGAYKVDVVDWFYSGTDVFFTIEKDFVLPADTDAAAFLAAASITQVSTEGIAINNLVKQLKSDGLWTDKIVEAWPLVGGTSGKHAKGLKQAYDVTFGAGVTHNADGITGNATSTGWMNTGINVSALGLRDSIGLYCYNREATTTAGGRMFGSSGTNARLYITEASGAVYGSGPCSGDLNTCSAAQSPDDRGHYWFGRTSSTSATIRFNSTSQTVANTAVSAPTDAPFFLAMNNAAGAGANPTNANLAFAAVTKGLTAEEYADLRAAVDAFQTALGRANP